MAKNYFVFQPLYTKPVFVWKPPTQEQMDLMIAKWATDQIAWEAQIKKTFENTMCGKVPAYSPSSFISPFGK